MKIKPDDIHIPCDDPFKHDLLERSQPAHILTNLLHNLEPPYTMSIDASWGNGKTTFLNMWKQYLEKEDFPVISFNAWETDFVGDPLVAITSELLKNTKDHQEDDSEKSSPETTLDTATHNLIKHLTPARVLAALSLGGFMFNIQPDDQIISTAIGAASVAAPAAYSISEEMDAERTEETDTKQTVTPPDPFTYHDTKKAICSFKTALQNVAKSLSSKNKPLVIAIDELDRCRPSYAVELLEVAKHFFSVDNIVFVLAIDKTQLSHAIKAIYGNDFDATGYLRRFIDLNFRLPDPNRSKLIKHLMKNTGINTFIENHPNPSWGSPSNFQLLLKEYMNLPALSIRQIQQAFHHLGLVLASLNTNAEIAYNAMTALTILKTISPEIYQRFVKADITDKEVVTHLSNLPGLQNVNPQSQALLEAFLIMGYGEFATLYLKPITTGPSLFHHYFDIIKKLPASPMYDSIAIDKLSPSLSDHEKNVLKGIQSLGYVFDSISTGSTIGFNRTAQRLDLLSNDLLSDTS